MVTKRDIKDTAFRLFASKGFHETSMEKLANALGIKKQSLYSHYKSKNEIFLTVLQEQTENIRAELDTLIRQHSGQPIAWLLKFFFIRITLYLADRDRLLLWKRIYISYERGALQDILTHTVREFETGVRGCLSEILAEKCAAFRNPRTLQTFLLSYMVLIQGYLDIVLLRGYRTETAECVWEIFWNGARAIADPQGREQSTVKDAEQP